MESSDPVRIVSAERMKDGLLIEFEDGECAIYPMALLRDLLPQAIPIEQPKNDE
jgi:hypothetical protein